MGQINIVFAGFSQLPAAAPPGWPAGLIWPAGNPNGSRQATVSDTDLLQLITWIAATQNAELNTGPSGAPVPVTLAQLLNAWAKILFAITRTKVQQYFSAPSLPPPIGLN